MALLCRSDTWSNTSSNTWSSSWTNCRASSNCRTSSWSKSWNDSFRWGICRALCTEDLLSRTKLIDWKAHTSQLFCISKISLLFIIQVYLHRAYESPHIFCSGSDEEWPSDQNPLDNVPAQKSLGDLAMPLVSVEYRLLQKNLSEDNNEDCPIHSMWDLSICSN